MVSIESCIIWFGFQRKFIRIKDLPHFAIWNGMGTEVMCFFFFFWWGGLFGLVWCCLNGWYQMKGQGFSSWVCLTGFTSYSFDVHGDWSVVQVTTFLTARKVDLFWFTRWTLIVSLQLTACVGVPAAAGCLHIN